MKIRYCQELYSRSWVVKNKPTTGSSRRPQISANFYDIFTWGAFSCTGSLAGACQAACATERTSRHQSARFTACSASRRPAGSLRQAVLTERSAGRQPGRRLETERTPGNLPGVVTPGSECRLLDIQRWCDHKTWRTTSPWKVHLVDSSFIQCPFETI